MRIGTKPKSLVPPAFSFHSTRTAWGFLRITRRASRERWRWERRKKDNFRSDPKQRTLRTNNRRSSIAWEFTCQEEKDKLEEEESEKD
ncbi:hypothetical protein Q7C36_008092 [Tachysurus vachellii]|uniref:Uncharacterized protein n=1 Tax=Tachysurus vachellii TaxID=175792 RepID=A0AA88NCL3_TACVA|nr:hypothetical protein Q7C36_008092 [Tachysurus vachellii]